jgi:hypothetical protein
MQQKLRLQPFLASSYTFPLHTEYMNERDKVELKVEAPSEQAQLVPAKNIQRSFPLCSGGTGIRRAGMKVAF